MTRVGAQESWAGGAPPRCLHSAVALPTRLAVPTPKCPRPGGEGPPGQVDV